MLPNSFSPKIIFFRFLLVLSTIASMAMNPLQSVDLSVSILNILTEAIPSNQIYTVTTYLSVIDNSGKPVTQLDNSNFNIYEDDQQISPDSIEAVTDEPISLVLGFDISPTMAGTPLQKAQQAATTNLVSKLGANDQAAVISFGNLVQVVSDFTYDHNQTIESIQSLSPLGNTATCLYDGIYKGIELASTTSLGRRAVVFLTDGKDDTQKGTPCSVMTEDDVINLANINRVPVYMLGFGKEVNTKSMERIALLTGGQYLYSQGTSGLGELFSTLTDQLKNQYKLIYTSHSTEGDHRLILEVEKGSLKDQDTRNFHLPLLAPAIMILQPSSGQTVQLDEDVKAEIEIIGKRSSIASVNYTIGEESWSSDRDPFSTSLNLTAFQPGAYELIAIALDASGNEITRASVNITLAAPPTPSGTASPISTPSTSKEELGQTTDEDAQILGMNHTTFIIVLVGVGLVLLVISIFLVLHFAKKKPEPTIVTPGSSEDKTLDGITVNQSGSGLARLTVVFSDVPNHIGQQMTVTKLKTSLGRSEGNDIRFQDDRPVSRHHAMLEVVDGQFFLSEVLTDENGIAKPPTFGTFVNDRKLVQNEKFSLSDGDIIRLGNRLRLKFNTIGRQRTVTMQSDHLDRTMDDFPTGEDVTNEA